MNTHPLSPVFVWGKEQDPTLAHIASENTWNNADGFTKTLCGGGDGLPVMGRFPPTGLAVCARCFAKFYWLEFTRKKP